MPHLLRAAYPALGTPNDIVPRPKGGALADRTDGRIANRSDLEVRSIRVTIAILHTNAGPIRIDLFDNFHVSAGRQGAELSAFAVNDPTSVGKAPT